MEGKLWFLSDHTKNYPYKYSNKAFIYSDILLIKTWSYIIFMFVLGCYELSGGIKSLNSLSECYDRCFKSQQNTFEHFAFKVQ